MKKYQPQSTYLIHNSYARGFEESLRLFDTYEGKVKKRKRTQLQLQ